MRVRREPRRGIAPSTASRAAFWRPDGDWLEHRTLLAAPPLESGRAAALRLLDDARCRTSCPVPARSISTR